MGAEISTKLQSAPSKGAFSSGQLQSVLYHKSSPQVSLGPDLPQTSFTPPEEGPRPVGSPCLLDRAHPLPGSSTWSRSLLFTTLLCMASPELDSR